MEIPFWWAPATLMPAGGCTENAFGWSCSNSEERWCASLAIECEEEDAVRVIGEDMEDRLAADCERCLLPQTTGLTMSGGDAVCDVCIQAELAEDEDVMF